MVGSKESTKNWTGYFQRICSEFTKRVQRGEARQLTNPDGMDWLVNPPVFKLKLTKFNKLLNELQAQGISKEDLRIVRANQHDVAFTWWGCLFKASREDKDGTELHSLADQG